jgi:hypothetical protein
MESQFLTIRAHRAQTRPGALKACCAGDMTTTIAVAVAVASWEPGGEKQSTRRCLFLGELLSSYRQLPIRRTVRLVDKERK